MIAPFRVGDSGCGAGCVSLSCARSGLEWWPCDVDHLCTEGEVGHDVVRSVCAAANQVGYTRWRGRGRTRVATAFCLRVSQTQNHQ